MKEMKKLMIALLLMISVEGFGQYVSIPDINFGNWLNTNGFSTCLRGNAGVGWQLDTTCAVVLADTSISCESSNISDLTGVQYFKNLWGLDFHYNNLSTLPVLPSSLKYLDCRNNQLSNLTGLPDSLSELLCGENVWLRGLPALPAGLTYLDCDASPIYSLPALPGTLKTLICGIDSLSSLPPLPNTMTKLVCANNQLTVLPRLPDSLIYLNCYLNRLTSLPALPDQMQALTCNSNHLTNLPPLPSGIYELTCDHNLLINLPSLPSGLNYLYCDHNQLTSLPLIPSSLFYLNCSYNHALSCLPTINPTIVYLTNFYIDSTNIQCMPNHFMAISYDIRPDSLPICGVGNTNGCQVYAPGDSVWPGDADANHIVDNTDLLPIGLAYDSIGPLRVVQGIVWQADAAQSWVDSFVTDVNFNHADCDGNGTINAADTSAILLNFGDVHAKTNGYNSTWRSGTPGLTVKLYNDTTYAGDTLTAKFFLGDSAAPVSNIYGLAFTYHYDPIVMDSTTFSFGFISSWLGTPANSINIQKNFAAAGVLKVAITGINHLGRSGFGQIATSRGIITTDNINAKDYSYYLISDSISDITAIDQLGYPVPLNAGIDSNKVGYYPNGIRESAVIPRINIYPNPASTQVFVSAESAISAIAITDMLGQTISSRQFSGKKTESLDISNLAGAVYIMHVFTAGGSGTARLIVSR